MRYIIVTRLFNSPPRLSQDNIYAALRTIDLTDSDENTHDYDIIQSTPKKNQYFTSVSNTPSSITRGSPSIPYASPLWNRSLQTPTHDRSTSGTV